MFKNHAAQVTFVKTPKAKDVAEPVATPNEFLEMIKKINQKDILRTATGVIGFYASIKTINTLSTIAINMTPKK